MTRITRCSACKRLWEGVPIMVPDDIMPSMFGWPSTDQVVLAFKRNRFNGQFSGWCETCFAKLGVDRQGALLPVPASGFVVLPIPRPVSRMRRLWDSVRAVTWA